MRIIAMSQAECSDLLTRISTGRLGCSLDDQPYVVPVSFSYEPDRLYIFSTLGKKVKWMRQNPKVCLQADEVGSGNTPWNDLPSILNGGEILWPKDANKSAISRLSPFSFASTLSR